MFTIHTWTTTSVVYRKPTNRRIVVPDASDQCFCSQSRSNANSGGWRCLYCYDASAYSTIPYFLFANANLHSGALNARLVKARLELRLARTKFFCCRVTALRCWEASAFVTDTRSFCCAISQSINQSTCLWPALDRRGRNDTINQSINLFSQLCNKNDCQQNNVKHSDGLPEKQIAHLSWSPK